MYVHPVVEDWRWIGALLAFSVCDFGKEREYKGTLDESKNLYLIYLLVYEYTLRSASLLCILPTVIGWEGPYVGC